MNRMFISGVVLVALGAASAPIQAQEEEARRAGFWIGFGIGGGVNTATVASNENRGGAAGYVRAGGAPSPHVVLGTEFFGWVTEKNDVTTGRGNVNVFVQYYPSKTGGLFFKGGLGRAGLSVASTLTSGTLVQNADGFGMTFGTGYEFRLSRIASLSANFDWLFQAFDDTSGVADTSSLLLFTVGITFPKVAS